MQLAGIGIFPEVHGTDSGIADTVASSAPVHEHIRLRQDPKSIEPMFLREAIVELFRQYDMNQTGYVDHDQITSMVYEIKLARRKVSNVEGQPSGLSWANQGFVADKIIDALDRDGNRRIDEKEFTTWLIGRICAHHEHRDNSHGKVSYTRASSTLLCATHKQAS